MKIKFLLLPAILFLIAVGAPLSSTTAYTLPSHDYPRLANLYWRTPITRDVAKELAKWDLLALDMQAGTNSAESIAYIRQLNPDIIILAYTSANEIPRDRLSIIEPSGWGLWHDLASGVDPNWELKTYQNENIVFWPGNIMANLYARDNGGKSYADYLSDFYHTKVLSTGLWDGLLFDNVWQDVSWVNGDIDIDNDGRYDSAQKINSDWQKGYNELFQNIRNRSGDKYLIIGNGDSNYHNAINGRMFEGFPEIWEGGWVGSMNRYKNVTSDGYTPRINILNSDTDNTGDYTDYKTMRYGLTSSLMYSSYYSFDFGTNLREQLWWYDEYQTNLGKPKSDPFNALFPSDYSYRLGVWQRDFENGAVLINSSSQNQTVNFESEYEKLHGTQDPIINNGAKITSLNLGAHDGVILLRPVNQITNSVFVNGSFARIFNGQGENIRTGFFAYNSKFKGSTKIITTDINNNGNIETIVADKNKITIYSQSGRRMVLFFPYDPSYTGYITMDIKDLDGDGRGEIITGTEKAGSNQIKIFSWYGKPINSGWYAFRKNWVNLGANVAAGDVDGDGENEIIAGAGAIGGPHVKIFNQNGTILENEFFAYPKTWWGGVYVATGDINGDGRDEIITGAGFGNEPHVKIFDGNGKLIDEWLAYSSQNKQGVRVLTADLDNDGKDEIIALTTNAFTISNFKL